jgi:hypothetical protein
MREVKTPTSTTLEITNGEELAIALELMDPLALGLFDRDVACGGEIPEGLMRAQINHREGSHAGSYVAGWLYVCAQRFMYQLVITPGSVEGGRWLKHPTVVFDALKKRTA